jgi:hypothetical protein
VGVENIKYSFQPWKLKTKINITIIYGVKINYMRIFLYPFSNIWRVYWIGTLKMEYIWNSFIKVWIFADLDVKTSFQA